jgi:diguanylate cyclase (GGDEF)-like protein
MPIAGRTKSEAHSLRELRNLGLLDSRNDSRFDSVIHLASSIFDVPVALVSPIDGEGLCISVQTGLDTGDVPPDISFRAPAMPPGCEMLVIADTATDPRFMKSPLVIGNMNIRFYAGIRLVDDATGQTFGHLCILDRKPRDFSPAALQNLRYLATVVSALMDLHRRTEALGAVAATDLLTGLSNRSAFDAVLASSFDDVTLGHGPGLLYIDLDHFKDVNDNFGHAAGDQVLVWFAALLRSCLSAGEIPARIGGDEFCVLLRTCEPGETMALGTRILDAARARRCEIAGEDLKLRLSIGCAEYPRQGQSPAELLQAADAALYRAKRMGRDNVQSA